MTPFFREQAWAHQAKEFEEHWDSPARALLWAMRTGKTKEMVDQACALYEAGLILGVLVLAPNGVHSNWTRRELPKHMWDGTLYEAMAWSSLRADRVWYRDQLSNLFKFPGLKWLSVNPDALLTKKCQEAIKAFRKATRDRFIIIYDESHEFRRPGARKTRLARGLARHASYRRILTGTALLNNLLHAFSQYELLEKGALGFTRFEDFKSKFARYETKYDGSGRRFEALAEYLSIEELRERMARWSSVVTRDDVVGMPDLIETIRPVPLSAKQRDAYKRCVTGILEELGHSPDDDGLTGGAKLLKLQQILGGFLYDEDGGVIEIDPNPPRLEAMVEQVMGTLPDKTIVWCRFTEDRLRVARRLEKEGLEAVHYAGTSHMSQVQRDDAEDRFREDPSVKVLVATAGHQGLDLSAASALIWYSHTHDAIKREQASERATKIGGMPVSVIDLVAEGTIDEPIIEALANKRSIADLVSGRGLRDLLASWV